MSDSTPQFIPTPAIRPGDIVENPANGQDVTITAVAAFADGSYRLSFHSSYPEVWPFIDSHRNGQLLRRFTPYSE